ncbi:hypothetical protein KJ359_009549 [Pestalotiopsis sp. 9143b]|nr:hypothetical protein KJ359_009549 [Pestalotiopsis sp. 9143b]
MDTHELLDDRGKDAVSMDKVEKRSGTDFGGRKGASVSYQPATYEPYAQGDLVRFGIHRPRPAKNNQGGDIDHELAEIDAEIDAGEGKVHSAEQRYMTENAQGVEFLENSEDDNELENDSDDESQVDPDDEEKSEHGDEDNTPEEGLGTDEHRNDLCKWMRNRNKTNKKAPRLQRPKGQVIYTFYTLRFLSFQQHEEFYFERVIVDEAHNCKNRLSKHARLVRLIPKKAVHGMTATPTINNVQDLGGLMQLTQSVADLPFIMHASSVPRDIAQLRDWSPFTEDDIWKPDVTESQKAIIKAYAEEHDARLWLLDEHMTKLIGGDANFENETSSFVFESICGMLISRRTMQTPLKLPNGKLCFPGADVPLSTVTTLEVGHTGEDRERLAMNVNFLLQNLFKKEGDDEAAHLPDFEDGGKRRPPAVKVDYSVERILQLITTDLRNLNVLATEDALTSAKSDEVEQAFISQSISLGTDRPTKKSHQKHLRKLQKEKKLTLGVDHVQHLIENDPDGGISYMFTLLNDPSLTPYSNRLEMFSWVIHHSPVYTAAMETFFKWYKQNERVLFVVFNQATQQ